MKKKMPPLWKRDNNPEINTAAPQLLGYSELCAESTLKRGASCILFFIKMKLSYFSASHGHFQ